MESQRLDRYTVAEVMFRFWWVVAAVGLAATVWLLWSIARSVA